MSKTYLLATAAILLTASAAQAAGWGDLTATFVFDGKAPVPKPIAVTKDQQYCGKFGLVDQSLVVNAKNGGIQNVVVYLMPSASQKVPISPDYEKTAKDAVEVDNNHCHFEPHIVLMRTSQTLVLANTDPIGHNTKGDLFNNGSFNDLIPAGGKIKKTFSQGEKQMSPLACSIHPWMSGYLLVKDDPYFGVSDADGKLTIKSLPVGKWTFVVWQEKGGYMDAVTQNGKKTEWKRGRVTVDIKAGANDLGTIKIPASTIDKKLRK
jgi:hypothetical protein